MPFERILQSVRRWLQHIAGHGEPYYLVVKRGQPDDPTNTPLYLEAEMDIMGKFIMAYRWTKNPSRATVFLHEQKIRVCNLPEDGFWYPVIEIPLHGTPTL